MNQLYALVVAGTLSLPAIASPLVTIACEQPMGYRVRYGAPARERVQAEKEKLPEPTAHLTGPLNDGYTVNPTFIIDSSRRYLVVTWSEPATDVLLRERAKEFGVPYCCDPPANTRADIVMYSPDQISDVEVNSLGAVTAYSFFPRLGAVLSSTQWHEMSGKSSNQLSTFSKCEFTWSQEP